MVSEAPFRHDGAAARHNTSDAIGCERNITQQYTCMNGEVIHALLSLLY